MSDNQVTEQWGIVELMGHKVVAGAIQKSEMLGKPMLRVDVPATSVFPAFTQFYGEAAVYCVTFTSKEVSCLTAEQCQVNPVSIYCPELIPAEKHREVVDIFTAQIHQLKRPALQGGNSSDIGGPLESEMDY